MRQFVWFCVVFYTVGSFAEGSAKELEWKASTNGWPESLWVYKVVSQEFSEPVISNLLAIASLSPKDRAKPPRDVSALDKGASYFTARDGSRHLAICPAKGWIEYKDERAEARMTEPAE